MNWCSLWKGCWPSSPFPISSPLYLLSKSCFSELGDIVHLLLQDPQTEQKLRVIPVLHPLLFIWVPWFARADFWVVVGLSEEKAGGRALSCAVHCRIVYSIPSSLLHSIQKEHSSIPFLYVQKTGLQLWTISFLKQKYKIILAELWPSDRKFHYLFLQECGVKLWVLKSVCG